jgi:bifunctional DNA-binding transcriptional regulator/antitoxin component of YhaV-PrlF toxin-antitoxin module
MEHEDDRFDQGPDRAPIPAAIRGEDGIRPGDQLEIDRVAPNEYRLRRIAPSNAGLVDRLLACPEKGYFVPIESESTASL